MKISFKIIIGWIEFYKETDTDAVGIAATPFDYAYATLSMTLMGK